MSKVTPQRAAELTGKSKSVIQRAMSNGKVSYEVDEGGRRVIDMAELERAFGLLPPAVAEPKQQPSLFTEEVNRATQAMEMERLQMKIRMLTDQLDNARDQIDDLKSQRDQWQKQAQQILITSQYTQNQAQELKDELKERERRAQVRRQQEMARRMQLQTGNQNQPGAGRTFWGKLRPAKAKKAA